MKNLSEVVLLGLINQMCIESLSPDVFEKWENVMGQLKVTRSSLKNNYIKESNEILIKILSYLDGIDSDLRDETSYQISNEIEHLLGNSPISLNK